MRLQRRRIGLSSAKTLALSGQCQKISKISSNVHLSQRMDAYRLYDNDGEAREGHFDVRLDMTYLLIPTSATLPGLLWQGFEVSSPGVKAYHWNRIKCKGTPESAEDADASMPCIIPLDSASVHFSQSPDHIPQLRRPRVPYHVPLRFDELPRSSESWVFGHALPRYGVQSVLAEPLS